MTKPKKPKPKVDSWMVIAKSLERLAELATFANESLARIETNLANRCAHQDEQLARLIELFRKHVADVDQLARMVTEKSIRRDLKTPTLPADEQVPAGWV